MNYKKVKYPLHIRSQQGATLIMVLMILLMITIVGVLAIRVALTSLNIATNSQIAQLLLQSSDTPINQFTKTDLSTVMNLSNVIGAALQESEANPGAEYIFCYRPKSTQVYAATIYSSIIQAGSGNSATLVEGGNRGFCNLTSDFGSSREAVVTQVAITIPTTGATDTTPGAYLGRGTNVSLGTGLPRNLVSQQRIRVTSTAIFPAYRSSTIETVKNNCLGGNLATGIRISDNSEPAMAGKQTLNACISSYNMPVNTQVQEFSLVTSLSQTTAP